MPVRFTILGSGSSGNCAYLETDRCRMLIDAGLSGRQIRERLADFGRSPESLTGIVITHEHSDHTQGLNTIATKLGIPVYCNRMTMDAVQSSMRAPCNFRLFETGAGFELEDVLVESFPVPHDSHDPVNFVLHTNSGRLAYLTDLGHATNLVAQRIRNADVMVLEANHDVQLLQKDTRRPWSIKQRILSRHGHMSNTASARLALETVGEKTRHVLLGHLSRDCNTESLAISEVTRAIAGLGGTPPTVSAATQSKSTPMIHL